MGVVVAGLVLGFLLSVPPTGPVALLVLGHLLRGSPGRAVRMGVGTAAADVPYAALAAFGYAALVSGRPALGAVLDASAAVLLLGVGAHLRRADLELDPAAVPVRWGSDAAMGFVLGLLNPTRLLTWGLAASVTGGAVGSVEPVVWGLAVGAGGATWWLTVAELWPRFGPRALAWRRRVLRGSAAVAVGLAILLVIRAVRVFAALVTC